MEIVMKDPEKWRGLPSMALPAICFIDYYLTKDMEVFEWGSGGSTIFFLRRAVYVHTIEHDGDWFDKISLACEFLGDDLLIGHNFSHTLPENKPSSKYASAWPGWAGWSFEKYVKDINAYPDNHFDVISVDGRARAACLLAAKPKLKPGGIMILDDAQRDRYKKAMSQMQMPHMDYVGDIPYQQPGLKVQTRIWVKEGVE